MKADETTKNLLPTLRSRREYFDYLDRWAVGTVDDLRAHMTSRALVKGFLLETSRANGARDAVAAIASTEQVVTPIDDTLYRLRWPGEPADWALMEIEEARYPVLYTALESDAATRRVDRLIQTPMLDRAWFAAPLFQRLWQLVIDAFPDHRFSQIVFEHESIYESFSEGVELTDEDDGQAAEEYESEAIQPERRRARIQIAERIGKLAKALTGMRPIYDPLESIVRLRIPAPRRGGHDVYYDGRFTNRSESIASLRQTIVTVKSIYRYSTETAEEASWPEVQKTPETGRPLSLGMPLLVKFGEKLEALTFERWVASLRRKNNRFRLWAHPIELGPGKVHMYAIDNHLWQPIDLEITREHVYALLPSGTCGNTIHRLITNIQRFVDPKVEAFIGDRRYEEFIENAPATTSA